MTIPSRKALFQRGEADHPITPLKLRLILFLAECQILTVPQLAGLTGMSRKAVQLHMRDLFDLGLVTRVGVPRTALADLDTPNDPSLLWGRAPIIYHLSKDGAKTLVEHGFVSKEDVAVIPELGPKNALFLAHELQVRDVRVWLERLSRQYPHRGVLSWNDGTKSVVGPARPDAVFVYQLGEMTMVGLVEIDRGTERGLNRWREKFAQYQAVYHTDAIAQATGYKVGRVLIICPDARRLENIAIILDRLLQTEPMLPDRLWLTERSTLDTIDLAAPTWRLAGKPGERRPLVPPSVLRP